MIAILNYSIVILDSNDGKKLGEINEDTRITSFDFTSDGSRILLTTENKQVKLYDVNSLECIRTGLINDISNSIILSQDETVFFILCRSRCISSYDFNTFEHLNKFECGNCNTFCINNDATIIIIGYNNGIINIIDATTGDNIITLNNRKNYHSHSISNLSFSADGTKFIAKIGTSEVKIWNSTTFECIKSFDRKFGAIYLTGFIDENKIILDTNMYSGIYDFVKDDFEFTFESINESRSFMQLNQTCDKILFLYSNPNSTWESITDIIKVYDLVEKRIIFEIDDFHFFDPGSIKFQPETYYTGLK